MGEEEYITSRELCEWLKICPMTASRWREEGMPYTGRARSFRYKKTEVLKWLNQFKNNDK